MDRNEEILAALRQAIAAATEDFGRGLSEILAAVYEQGVADGKRAASNESTDAAEKRAAA